MSKSNLLDSELAILDLIILQAIERGESVAGLFIDGETLEKLNHRAKVAEDQIPSDWVDKVKDAAKEVIDRVSALDKVERENFSRAISHDPDVQRSDLSESELKSVLLSAGESGRPDTSGLTIDELRAARRELRMLAFQSRK